MSVTKSELIEDLSIRAKLPKDTAEQVVNTVFESMVDALVQGRRIEVRGFGSFEVRSYKGYKGRNPRTGEAVEVAPKKLPFFKVGKDLRERVNQGAGTGLPPDPSDDDPSDDDPSDAPSRDASDGLSRDTSRGMSPGISPDTSGLATRSPSFGDGNQGAPPAPSGGLASPSAMPGGDPTRSPVGTSSPMGAGGLDKPAQPPPGQGFPSSSSQDSGSSGNASGDDPPSSSYYSTPRTPESE